MLLLSCITEKKKISIFRICLLFVSLAIILLPAIFTHMQTCENIESKIIYRISIDITCNFILKTRPKKTSADMDMK
jgi:hypothetical protein